MIEKHALLMATYKWSKEKCRTGMTSAEGWVWYAAAKEMQMGMFGQMWQIKGKAYIGQEREKLLKQCRNSDNKKNV